MRNRADVVTALREAGLEVPRQGKNYLTALDPATGDRWRPGGCARCCSRPGSGPWWTAAALDTGHQGGSSDSGAARGGHLGDRAPGDRRGAVRGAADRYAGPSALDRGRAACREAVERVKELYDRAGTAVDEGLAGVVRAVRAGVAAAGRSLGAARRTAQRASDALGPGLQDARRDVARALEVMRRRGRERDHGPSR